MKRNPNSLAAYSAALLCIGAAAMILTHSTQSADAVRNGLAICADSVIPSLFPMMFLAQYFVKSGGAEQIGKWLQAPMRLLFGLPGICGAVILTGFIGGYPSGAAAAEALTAQGKISRPQGERLANIAFCSGPGFTVGMIGTQLYKNKSAGLLILTAQIISCIIIGTAMRWIDGAPKGAVSYQPAKWSTGYRPKNAFVESASSASSAVLAMCGFIVLFQVINAMPVVSVCNAFMARLLASRGWSALGESLVPCLLEVTRGCMLSVTVGLPFTAFVAGFGGLSVHFQNFAICREIQPDKPRYLLLRLTQGCLCSVLVSVGLRLPFFADQLAVTSAAVSTEGMTMRFSGISDSFGAVMLIMCLMSVICLPRVTTRSDV